MKKSVKIESISVKWFLAVDDTCLSGAIGQETVNFPMNVDPLGENIVNVSDILVIVIIVTL